MYSLFWILIADLWYILSCCQRDWKTYVHNWLLKPFSHYYDLVSHSTHVVCVYFINADYDFWGTFNGNFSLLSGFLPEICWEEVADRKFFHISFWLETFDLGVWTEASLLRASLQSNICSYLFLVGNVRPGVWTEASLLRGNCRWNIFSYFVLVGKVRPRSHF